MNQSVWTLTLATAAALLAIYLTSALCQKTLYGNMGPLDRFNVLCQLAPCQLQPDEELFFCSCARSVALTSRRLLLWVREGKQHRLVSLNINQIEALKSDESLNKWELPAFIAAHAGTKTSTSLYIHAAPDVQHFDGQVITLAREDLSDFDFWYEYAQTLNGCSA